MDLAHDGLGVLKESTGGDIMREVVMPLGGKDEHVERAHPSYKRLPPASYKWQRRQEEEARRIERQRRQEEAARRIEEQRRQEEAACRIEEQLQVGSVCVGILLHCI